MGMFSNDRDYDVTVNDASGKRVGNVRYHCNAIPQVGGSVVISGKTRKVVDVAIDYDAMNKQTQHTGTDVPVIVTVE